MSSVIRGTDGFDSSVEFPSLTLLWSGTAGTSGVVLPLSSPLRVGDLVVVEHSDANNTTAMGVVLNITRQVTVTFGATGQSGFSTTTAGSGITSLTTVSLTAGYGVQKIYRLRLLQA